MAVTHALLRSVNDATLFVAFELGASTWVLGMTAGFEVRPWLTRVRAGDWRGVQQALGEARRRFGLSATCRVVSCYEAGRDGFWVHRALVRLGVANRVVDSASIEVSRRPRRAKTDRLDARKLVQMLVRAQLGDTDVWREVRVPSETAEAARHVSRERTQLVQERTRVMNQMRSWLATLGARLPRRRKPGWWTTVCDWANAPIPGEVQARLARAEERLALITTQLAHIDAVQQRAATSAAPGSAVRRLVQLKGVAATGASALLAEGLVWREFRNRRQVGGMLGFAPLPYQSGEGARDQGIDRAGNSRWRALSLQLAWNWVQWQPTSALTQWFQQQFGQRGARARRIGIVALARKLLIALWRYATTGVPPAGAQLKGA